MGTKRTLIYLASPPFLLSSHLFSFVTFFLPCLFNSRNQIKTPSGLQSPFSQTFIPCLNYTYLSDYLTRDDVKSSLHISNSSFPWTPCSPYIEYNQFNANMYPFYNFLLNLGSLRVMVYSGDADSCVPYLGTERCVRGLGLEVTQQWAPWTVTDSTGKPQTAGYAISFEKVGS
jgi:hypothetical protein